MCTKRAKGSNALTTDWSSPFTLLAQITRRGRPSPAGARTVGWRSQVSRRHGHISPDVPHSQPAWQLLQSASMYLGREE